MYNEGVLKTISNHLNKSIEEVLEIYKNKILFVPDKDDPNIGLVVKECKGFDLKLKDIITVKKAEYIDIDGDKLGITSDILNVSKMHIPKLKREKTKKELNGKNILTAVKMITELFDIDPDSTMEQLIFMNEKIRMRNKLIEEGFETKEQRKHVHNALKYCAKNIKTQGSDGAAEDTAEKYRIEAKKIKHLRGFHNRLFVNPFK